MTKRTTQIMDGEVIEAGQSRGLAVLPAMSSDPMSAIDTYLAGRNTNTRRAYAIRLERFEQWRMGQQPAPFVAQLKNYIVYLQDAGLSPRSVQAHVTTIKGLLKTAAALDISGDLARALPTLDLAKAPAVRGQHQGNRLTEAQRNELIATPGISTHKGRRDTVILALLSLIGLRRSEVCALNWGHIATLEGHHVIQNLSGKHGRIRTLQIDRIFHALMSWAELAGIDRSPDSPVFIAVTGKGDRVKAGQRLTANAIAWLVKDYAATIRASDFTTPENLAPHDLRRTAASLARRGGASIEQVQVMLGHASPQTTSNYIGEGLDLDDYAADYGKVKIPLFKVAP